jgi:hypothetical protein
MDQTAAFTVRGEAQAVGGIRGNEEVENASNAMNSSHLLPEEESVLSVLLSHVRAERWDELIKLLEEREDRTEAESPTQTPRSQMLYHILNVYANNDEMSEFPLGSLLHILCTYSSVPVQAIQMMIEVGGPIVALQAHNHFMQQTPLHIAIQNIPERFDIVQELVRVAPASVNERDAQYLRPIEILCQTIIMKEERDKYYTYWRRPQDGLSDVDHNGVATGLWECVHVLADTAASLSHPLPSKQPVSQGCRQIEALETVAAQEVVKAPKRQPIVHACLQAPDFPLALTERAIKRYPEQLRQPDEKGDLPLHIVARQLSPASQAVTNEEDDSEEKSQNGYEEEDFLNQVIAMYPAAASRWNHQRQTPLDVAIESGRRWNSGIARLLEAHPAGLENRRLPLGYYPKVLAQIVKLKRWGMLYGILQSKPDLLRRN